MPVYRNHNFSAHSMTLDALKYLQCFSSLHLLSVTLTIEERFVEEIVCEIFESLMLEPNYDRKDYYESLGNKS